MRRTPRQRLIAGRRDAALIASAVVQLVMLSTLLAHVPPHPPERVALFAIGPFLAASLAVTLACLAISPQDARLRRGMSMGAGLLGLVSFGPHKLFDPQIASIWPAVLVGGAAAVALIWPTRADREAWVGDLDASKREP